MKIDDGRWRTLFQEEPQLAAVVCLCFFYYELHYETLRNHTVYVGALATPRAPLVVTSRHLVFARFALCCAFSFIFTSIFLFELY